LKNAEEQRINAESLRKEYEGHLANIADDARAKLDQVMKDAEVARQRLLDSTQTDIQALHQRFESQKALEWEQLRRDLRNDMADVAVLAASKALRSQLTPDLQSAVISQVIHELDTAQGSIIN
jgi:F-type H+-transporting ATPase subunit b